MRVAVMPGALLLTTIWLIGCSRGGAKPQGGGECGNVETAVATATTAATRPVRIPTVAASTFDDFRDVLTKYYGSTYRATYALCGPFRSGKILSGHSRWHKDADKRLRVDDELSLDGGSLVASTFVIQGDREARMATCSDNLGEYFRNLSGGAFQEPSVSASFGIDAYTKLGATCVNEPFDSGNDVLAQVGPLDPHPIALNDFNKAPDVYAPQLREERRKIGNQEAVCFKYGDSGPHATQHDDCFADDGVLLSSSVGTLRIEATNIEHRVEDVDFEPLYAVVAAPDQCAGGSPWDRLDTTNPDAARPLPQSPGDFRDAAIAYFRTRFTGTYRACFHGGEDTKPFSGTIAYIKDGTRRARFDVVSDSGEPRASYFVDADSHVVCSEDASQYLSTRIAPRLRNTPAIAALLNDKQACFPDSKDLNSCVCYGVDREVLQRIVGDIVSAIGANTEAWKSIDLPYDRKTERTVGGLHATCFERREGQECFSDNYFLLSTRDGVRATFEPLSVSPSVNDADFELPYELKPGLP